MNFQAFWEIPGACLSTSPCNVGDISLTTFYYHGIHLTPFTCLIHNLVRRAPLNPHEPLISLVLGMSVQTPTEREL